MGAGIVALGAAHSMHEVTTDPAALTNVTQDRGTLGHASRDNNRDVNLQQADTVGVEPWMAPLQNYTVSSAFSLDSTNLHPGIDLAARGGTPYYATHSGTVKLARANGGYGYAVILDLGDGTTIMYGHSSKLYVTEGQRVIAGEVLGLVGDSGYAFGDGLYFEVRVQGNPVNPQTFLVQRGVDISKGAQSASN